MVVPAVLGGALLVAFVILVAILAKASGHSRRRSYSGADGGSSFAAFSDGGSDGCDSGSSADGGCGDGGGGGGGGGGD
jgi:hypothetical protein